MTSQLPRSEYIAKAADLLDYAERVVGDARENALTMAHAYIELSKADQHRVENLIEFAKLPEEAQGPVSRMLGRKI